MNVLTQQLQDCQSKLKKFDNIIANQKKEITKLSNLMKTLTSDLKNCRKIVNEQKMLLDEHCNELFDEQETLGDSINALEQRLDKQVVYEEIAREQLCIRLIDSFTSISEQRLSGEKEQRDQLENRLVHLFKDLSRSVFVLRQRLCDGKEERDQLKNRSVTHFKNLDISVGELRQKLFDEEQKRYKSEIRSVNHFKDLDSSVGELRQKLFDETEERNQLENRSVSRFKYLYSSVGELRQKLFNEKKEIDQLKSLKFYLKFLFLIVTITIIILYNNMIKNIV